MSQTSDSGAQPVTSPLAMPQPELVAAYVAWQCRECGHENLNPGLLCGNCGGWGPAAPVSDVPGASVNPDSPGGNTPENADRPPSDKTPTYDQLRVRLRDARSEVLLVAKQLRQAEEGIRWRERLLADLEERNTRLLSGRDHWRRVAGAETALRAALGHPVLAICHAGPSPREGLYCTLFKDHVGKQHVSAVDGCVQARWKDE